MFQTFENFVRFACQKYKPLFKNTKISQQTLLDIVQKTIEAKLKAWHITPRTIECYINWVDNDCLTQTQIGDHLGITQEGVRHHLNRLRKAWPEGYFKENEAAFNSLYGQYKYNAKRRRLIFDLSSEQFYTVTKQNCYYCGAEPSKPHNRGGIISGGYIHNGLDRLNNDIGYVQGNVVACCTLCNRMKANRHIKVFLSHAAKIFNYQTRGANVQNV